jgi:predicted DNA binding CopG/RHH family protein
LEEVPEPVFQRQVETVAVPLQAQEIQAVKRIAESHGVDYVALIQGWVLEKLHSS